MISGQLGLPKHALVCPVLVPVLPQEDHVELHPPAHYLQLLAEDLEYKLHCILLVDDDILVDDDGNHCQVFVDIVKE